MFLLLFVLFLRREHRARSSLLAARCSKTSFEKKLGQAQHRYNIRHLRHHCADCVLTPLKEFGILSEEAGSLPRSAATRQVLDRLALRVQWELCRKQGLIIIMYRQVVQPSTLTNCRDQRSEDNLGYEYIYGQATEAQSNRYYGSTQNHRSGQLSTLLCQRTKISYFN